MEESKYYIPGIEEFVIGLNYQKNEPHRLYYRDDMPVEYKWCDKVYSIRNQEALDKLDRQIFQKNIRVKSLDKEDIESLGFIQTIEDQYYKDDFELLVDDDLFIQIIKDNGFVFQGTIKNKSELKKLLIQTGIINERNKI